MTDVAVPPIDEFRAAFKGELLSEGDGGYDEARKIFNVALTGGLR